MSKNSTVAGKTPEQVRRAETAVSRQEAYATRTPQEQLEKLNQRPGEATKERRKLLGLLADKAESETRKRRRSSRKPGESSGTPT